MWLQWRYMYAEGPGEWDWYDFGDRAPSQWEVEDLCIDLSQNYCGGRAVEHRLVAAPPIDHLRKVVREHEASIRNLRSAKKRVEAIIQDLETAEYE